MRIESSQHSFQKGDIRAAAGRCLLKARALACRGLWGGVQQRRAFQCRAFSARQRAAPSAGRRTIAGRPRLPCVQINATVCPYIDTREYRHSGKDHEMPSTAIKRYAQRRPRHSNDVAAEAARAKLVRAAAVRGRARSEDLMMEVEAGKGHGKTRRGGGGSKNGDVIVYHAMKGVKDYVSRVARATPLQLVEIERQGVLGSFIKDLSKRMEIPSSRIFRILGIPKATAEKKAAGGERVAGRGGQAALGLVKLLGRAQEIAAKSTASEAKTFDAAKWLGQWIERPQPSLAGRKPADLLDTPTGVEVVARLLGSIESGAYQ